jgi:hypothetical protein
MTAPHPLFGRLVVGEGVLALASLHGLELVHHKYHVTGEAAAAHARYSQWIAAASDRGTDPRPSKRHRSQDEDDDDDESRLFDTGVQRLLHPCLPGACV